MKCNDSRVIPFLKWAGGKRWLVESAFQAIPDKFNRYIEPFLGGGAVLFSHGCSKGIVSDLNADLITTYKAIQKDWHSVEKKLREHARNHSDEYYYKIRASRPIKGYSVAAKFIYLNRTCWNGLYRVNLNGEFNVPRGTKNSVILKTDNLSEISRKLSGYKIYCRDFEETISEAKEGDFVFIDPPYTVKHNVNGFIKYNEKLFHWDDQMRLKEAIEVAVDKGVMLTVSNADHDSIKELYSDLGEITIVDRKSVIAGNSVYRGNTTEVIIRVGWSV